MKKIIFKNFLRETTIFFLLSCSSVALIVWVIQAVNYLGFVTEDGHGFKIYFLYTLLSLPKIVNEILPFMFFFAVFFTLVKYEDQNQTLIFWSKVYYLGPKSYGLPLSTLSPSLMVFPCLPSSPV